MARVTPREVSQIVEVSSELSLAPFIDMATALVDWLVSQDSAGLLGSKLPIHIEKLLSAHFYSHLDQLYTSKSTGGASGSFQGQTGMHLESTQYGQSSMDLDLTGKLAERNKGERRVVRAYWLGRARDI